MDNFLFKYFSDKYRIVHHLLFWSIYFLDFFLTIVDPEAKFGSPSGFSFVYMAFDMVMIYANLYWLIPNYLLKGKPITYFLFTFLIVGLNIFATTFVALDQCGCVEKGITALIFFKFLFGATENITYFLGSAIGLKLFKIWIKAQRKIKFLENENLRTELNYLKSQMNPHFLFNTLNNIFVQTKIDANDASHTILKLSDLLRYQLYDCSNEKVKLSDEIDYLKNYLELERIRKNMLNIDFRISGNIKNTMIPPFLFIAFVENAVKHGGSGKSAYISIKLEVTYSTLIFEIENSLPDVVLGYNKGGLGLTNVKRRLELLYPEKHRLMMSDEENKFYLILQLQLKD